MHFLLLTALLTLGAIASSASTTPNPTAKLVNATPYSSKLLSQLAPNAKLAHSAIPQALFQTAPDASGDSIHELLTDMKDEETCLKAVQTLEDSGKVPAKTIEAATDQCMDQAY